jgi:DNA-binding beta-propeller fold protein YncE
MDYFGQAGQGYGLTLKAHAAHAMWLAVAVALLIALGSAFSPSAATAAEAPATLWTRCLTDSEEDVSCQIPRGVAADPSSGHVFVADQVNRRIDEFTALGAFVKTWGWDVVASGPDSNGTGFEICVPAQGDTCKAGISGSGAGQFGAGQGVAIDSIGDIYVVDFTNSRVEKFDPQGHFLLMFGDGVDQGPTHPGDLCTAQFIAEGDTCGAGAQGGAGEGQFSWPVAGSFIAIDPSDKVYVGDQNRIQRFTTGGVYQGEIALPGETVQSLAVDGAGNLYATYSEKDDVRKISPAGVELPSPRFKVPSPSAVAVDSLGDVYAFGPVKSENNAPLAPVFEFDSEGHQTANFGEGEFTGSTGLATNLCPGGPAPGNLYATNDDAAPRAFLRAYGPEPTSCGKAITGAATEITETGARLRGEANPKGLAVSECFFEYGTTTAYGKTAPCAESSGEIGTGSEPVPVHADIGELTGGTVYHVRLVVGTATGTEAGSDKTFKTLGPPVISVEHASAVAYTEATLKALVNPEGFATEYHFEYGTDTTYGHSTTTIAIGADRNQHPAIANLKGLTPGTTYHWRLLATNTALANGGISEGEDHTFTTFPQPTTEAGCGNEALRTGASAFLPDCRAYEMVTPVDKNGGDILRQFDGYVRVSDDGEKLAYSADPTFGDQPASLAYNQYLARRQAGGWANQGIHPPFGKGGKPLPEVLFGLIREFDALSPDLCNAWYLDTMDPPLTPEGQDGYANIYRLDLCGSEPPEALTSVAPPAGTRIFYVNQNSIEGYSADSRHALLVAKAKLTTEATATTTAQVYDRFGGALHLVSILPNGKADAKGDGVGGGQSHNLDNAVSEDGSRVYWTAGAVVEASGTGKIFVRRHPEQGKVEGECGEAAKACTLAVSSGNEARYWTAAADGSKALYSEEAGTFEGSPFEDGLFEFDLKAAEEGKPAQRLIAEGVTGVAGASDDLSRIYFVSTEVLSGSQENSEHDIAEAGKPNLYLEEGGTATFIATLIPGDVARGPQAAAEASGYQVDSQLPYTRATRVSAEGGRIAFESRARLGDFDNTDAQSGQADLEVFTYEAGGALECVSCNPSGAQPSEAPELREPFIRVKVGERDTHVFASAWIQPWEHSLYASHVLSDNGNRLFFHSYEALVPRDTNGAMDVYEWEAPGEGGCSEESHAFHASNGGCIFLISSGESPFESEFWDASPDGRDVFFSTESSLVPKDPGQVDLYDARVGGGFAEASQKAACEGEACQSPPAPPLIQTPASAAYNGPGNLDEGNPSCPKGKHRVTRKGKASCVKPKKKNKKQKGAAAKQRAKANRGARR